MPNNPSSSVKQPLSRARILQAALQLADEKGLDFVSMREVARSLHVEAMSLYKHVANKDAILDGLLDLVMGEIQIPAAEEGWRSVLRGKAIAARRVLLQHRWAAVLIESRTSPVPARLRMHNTVLHALKLAGFTWPLAYNAYLSIDSYTYGFVLQETAGPTMDQNRPEAIETVLPDVPMQEYPDLAAFLAHLARDQQAVNPDADFAFGLDLLLDGIEKVYRERSTVADLAADLAGSDLAAVADTKH